jgi:hypothetical protein
MSSTFLHRDILTGFDRRMSVRGSKARGAHGPVPGTKYHSQRANRLAPKADLRSSTGRRYLELQKNYLALMPHKPGPIERDQLVTAVMLRLKLDELESEQIKTGRMGSAYFPIANAHDRLLRVLRIINTFGTTPEDTPVSTYEKTETARAIDIAKMRAALEVPFVEDDDGPEAESETIPLVRPPHEKDSQ